MDTSRERAALEVLGASTVSDFYRQGDKKELEKDIDIAMRHAQLEAERDKLRAMLSWAAGRLLDAGDMEAHEKVMAALEEE